MSWLSGIPAWFTDGAHWRGDLGVPHLLAQHLGLSAAALGAACLLALPVGVVLGHTGRGGVLAVQVSNAGRAVPVLSLLGILTLLLGRTTGAALLAFTAFAIPPLLINAYTGVREVDPGAVDAARGMGMTGAQVLRRVELPLATPLIMAGVRLAAVQVVATVSIAAIFAFGGLGRIITTATGASGGVDLSAVLAGALIIAVVAMAVEVGFAWLARRADPVARAQRRSRRPSGGRASTREGAVTTS